MPRFSRWKVSTVLAAATFLFNAGGCTSLRDYLHNGLKVGPEYHRPAAPAADAWIEEAKLNTQREDLRNWWTAFVDPVLEEPDPVLNYLVRTAYEQNLTLRQAGMRVLQARAQLGIVRGYFFPQQQDFSGGYSRNGASLNPPTAFPDATGRFTDSWNFGFSLNWELDFWGRFRRAITAADADLDAAIEGYDAAIVTLLGDVASNYVQMRTSQEQIRLTRENVELQRNIVEYLRFRAKQGYGSDVDLNKDQAESVLAQTEANIPQYETTLRQANDAICTLLGMPPVDLREAIPLWKEADRRKEAELEKVGAMLEAMMARGGTSTPELLQQMTRIVRPIYIPAVPGAEAVAIGMPADLLRRRPDVRRAERLAAAQGEEIGIAQADLYPAFSINGQLGYRARTFKHLFQSDAFTGSIGPSFNWNILNYGRIINDVRLQDALFQERVLAYQEAVLTANREVEDGLVTFLRSDERRKLLGASVRASLGAVRYVTLQKAEGQIDVNRYSTIAQNLVQQEVLWAQSHGAIAQGLIAVYRALGGGWEIRLESEEEPEAPSPDEATSESAEAPESPVPNDAAAELAPPEPKTSDSQAPEPSPRKNSGAKDADQGPAPTPEMPRELPQAVVPLPPVP